MLRECDGTEQFFLDRGLELAWLTLKEFKAVEDFAEEQRAEAADFLDEFWLPLVKKELKTADALKY